MCLVAVIGLVCLVSVVSLLSMCELLNIGDGVFVVRRLLLPFLLVLLALLLYDFDFALFCVFCAFRIVLVLCMQTNDHK